MTTQPEALRLADRLRDGWGLELRREAEAELRRLHAENDRLRTVMVAAAEEIDSHWEAHCDSEGYGPVNLMRRLEEGIAAEYGYTAGEFERLRSQRDALLKALHSISLAAQDSGSTREGMGLYARAAIAQSEDNTNGAA